MGIPLMGLGLGRAQEAFESALSVLECEHKSAEDTWMRHPELDAVHCRHCNACLEWQADGSIRATTHDRPLRPFYRRT